MYLGMFCLQLFFAFYSLIIALLNIIVLYGDGNDNVDWLLDKWMIVIWRLWNDCERKCWLDCDVMVWYGMVSEMRWEYMVDENKAKTVALFKMRVTFVFFTESNVLAQNAHDFKKCLWYRQVFIMIVFQSGMPSNSVLGIWIVRLCIKYIYKTCHMKC